MDKKKCESNLLQYISGEISFETWFEGQQQQTEDAADSSSMLDENHTAPHVSNLHDTQDDSSSVFSSWGTAFTSKRQQLTESALDENDDDDDDDEELDDDLHDAATIQQALDDSVEQTDSTVLSILSGSCSELKLPDFSGLPVYKPSDDNQIQGPQLIPFIETLFQLIPTSTLRPLSGTTKQPDDEEVPDIMKDFHNFQLRKRSRKGANAMRNKLPELCRLQMGQANLLVAKGDFKHAAEICMEVVREAPTSGIPFKTLSFIYEEQGNKEMSLQYWLISAFLDCKDPQEWIELSKRCLESGNMKQALSCYDRACKFNPGNIILQWERARMYFSLQDYRKALDIYQVITKLLKPQDEFTYIEMAKDMAKLYHHNGLVDKAGETLEAAFEGCPSYKDHEVVNLLSEIYIGSKKYGKVIKLITSRCGVKLPHSKTSNQKDLSMEEQSLHALNSLLNKTVTNDFKDLTSTMASIASTTSGLDYTESSSMLADVVNDTTYEKQFTTLQPVQTKSIVATPSIFNSENKDVEIPDDLALDLRIKLAICMINRKELNYVKTVIEPLFRENLEDVGDLLFDVAEAYFETGQFEDALKYLIELVKTQKYNQAGVWLKIGECYEHLDNTEKCIDSYYQVLVLAPLQASVRLSLASALRSIGRNEDAIAVLAEYEEACVDEEGEEKITLSDENRLKIEEYESWYRKCLYMYQEKRLRDFIFHGYVLMYNYLSTGYLHQKKQKIGKIHFWEFMLKILNVSVKLKEYKKAINLLEQAMLFKPYAESKKYRLELDYLQTTLYFVSGEYSKAFDSFRSLLTHESEETIKENSIWNLFTQIANRMLDKRHHRFTLRLLFKRPKLLPLVIHNGNNSHLSGTYKYAIGEFSRAFREWPTYPLNSLLLGISFLHLSCQKFHKTRHTSILHGIIFMFQYFNLREGNQEAYYNLGRAFHQIGLVHFAVFYYNKALEFPLHEESLIENPRQANYHPYIDLHREAGYNLHLIYKASGNIYLARKILYKYCWI